LGFFEARDSKAEAEYAADRIRILQGDDPAAHVAVLYRTNSQSRAFEEALRARGMRYRMLGGFSFYQRAEIKDALAYARLVIFPDDDIALLRVINTPPRGIGKTTVDSLTALAQQHDTSLWAALGKMLAPASSGRAIAPLKDFRKLIEDLKGEVKSSAPADFLQSILIHSGYLDMLMNRDSSEDTARADNLRELVNAMAEGTERGETLTDFLDHARSSKRFRQLRRARLDHADDAPQRQGAGVRSRVSDRNGGRSLPAQPVAKRPRRTRRRAPPVLRGDDAREGITHAYARGNIVARMAPNVSPGPCLRAFSRKFLANSSIPRRVPSPTPEKHVATNPIRNTPSQRKNFPAGCVSLRRPPALPTTRPAERVQRRNRAWGAPLARRILSWANGYAMPLTEQGPSSASRARERTASSPCASPITE